MVDTFTGTFTFAPLSAVLTASRRGGGAFHPLELGYHEGVVFTPTLTAAFINRAGCVQAAHGTIRYVHCVSHISEGI